LKLASVRHTIDHELGSLPAASRSAQTAKVFFGKLTARFEKIPRCHTGHSFSVSALLTSQSEKIQETLWVSLRMFEERKNLQNNIAQQQSQVKGKSPAAQRAKDSSPHRTNQGHASGSAIKDLARDFHQS
jgi:hypothetical protein